MGLPKICTFGSKKLKNLASWLLWEDTDMRKILHYFLNSKILFSSSGITQIAYIEIKIILKRHFCFILFVVKKLKKYSLLSIVDNLSLHVRADFLVCQWKAVVIDLHMSKWWPQTPFTRYGASVSLGALDNTLWRLEAFRKWPISVLAQFLFNLPFQKLS